MTASVGLTPNVREVRHGSARRAEAVDDRRVGDDQEVAARTIPRGRSAEDRSRAPAVDTDVWFAHVRYARTRDRAQLSRLVAEYDRYATSIARRFHRDREPRQDLDQLAREALVVALQRFDPERGLPFVSYATPTIIGALRRHYRDHGWLIRVPRRVHELTGASRSAHERLSGQLGRAPTMVEVAAALGVAVDDVVLAHDAAYARETSSLDAIGADGADLGSRHGADDPALDLVEVRSIVASAMGTLAASSRELVRMYYFEGRSQAQIATHLGVSQMQVSRLLTAVLNSLRARVVDRPLTQSS